MIKTIYYLVLNELKNKRSLILMFILLLSSIMLIQNFNQKALYENIDGKRNLDDGVYELYLNHFDHYNQRELKEFYYLEIEKIRKSAYENNWNEYNKKMVEINLFFTKYFETFKNAYINESFHEPKDLKLIEKYKNELNALLSNYDTKVKDLKQDYTIDVIHTSSFYELYSYFQYYARYFDKLVESHDEPVTPYTVESISIPYHIMNQLLPVFVILLVSILFFDSFHKDQETGVIKTLLSHKKKRSYYLHTKFITQLIVVMFTVFIPMIAVSVPYIVSDKLSAYDRPVLYHEEGLKNFKLTYNNLAYESKDYTGNYFIGYTRYSDYADELRPGPNPDFNYIEMWKFLSLSFVLFFIFCIFLIQLQMLLSNVFLRKEVSILVYFILAFLGVIVSPVSSVQIWNLLNPFAYRNPIVNLAGTSSYNYCSGFCILTVYILILYVFNRIVLKKKDI